MTILFFLIFVSLVGFTLFSVWKNNKKFNEPANPTPIDNGTVTPITDGCATLGQACDSGGLGAPTCCDGLVCDDGDGTGGNLGVCVEPKVQEIKSTRKPRKQKNTDAGN